MPTIAIKWCACISGLSEGDELDDQSQLDFLASCQTYFVGWLLLHMLTVGSNGRRQMFYITFILHYFGLSRDGINVLSKYGFGVTLDMFDTLRQSYRAGSEAMTRYTSFIVSHFTCCYIYILLV